jgi:hypothetical protein
VVVFQGGFLVGYDTSTTFTLTKPDGGKVLFSATQVRVHPDGRGAPHPAALTDLGGAVQVTTSSILTLCIFTLKFTYCSLRFPRAFMSIKVRTSGQR